MPREPWLREPHSLRERLPFVHRHLRQRPLLGSQPPRCSADNYTPAPPARTARFVVARGARRGCSHPRLINPRDRRPSCEHRRLKISGVMVRTFAIARQSTEMVSTMMQTLKWLLSLDGFLFAFAGPQARAWSRKELRRSKEEPRHRSRRAGQDVKRFLVHCRGGTRYTPGDHGFARSR